jgi:tRNA uridine 5-carboxymethylaminomethyl modification enzyme
VNGTSGYEEAAAQGLVAGINAALRVKGEPSFIPQRSESYIGVLIDDLINKGTDEPYRIFTSRAEYRLLLRQDNADSRLMRKGHELGLISRETISRLDEKERLIADAKQLLKETTVHPHQVNELLVSQGSQPIADSELLEKLLKRPEIGLASLMNVGALKANHLIQSLAVNKEAFERTEIEVKYEGYLKRQQEQIVHFKKHEGMTIPNEFKFDSLKSLSKEGREKLARVQPRSIGQASRISGVTPADISVLMIALR